MYLRIGDIDTLDKLGPMILSCCRDICIQGEASGHVFRAKEAEQRMVNARCVLLCSVVPRGPWPVSYSTKYGHWLHHCDGERQH